VILLILMLNLMNDNRVNKDMRREEYMHYPDFFFATLCQQV
jgi:hypothetical protein